VENLILGYPPETARSQDDGNIMTRPDIVLTSCRDEEDIIGVFIQYYLEAGFDAVHVIDNGSQDRTADCVRKLESSGLPVSLQYDPREGYERFFTEWLQSVGERYKPRWIFFLDCDEFILFPTGVKKYLNALPPEINKIRLQQKEIYPDKKQDKCPGGFLLSRRAETSFEDTTKEVIRWHREAIVYGGKHKIELPNPELYAPTDIFIRHYKYRTFEQSFQKEKNKVANQKIYTDQELAQISSFDLQTTRRWIEYCEQTLSKERWRDSFSPDCPAIYDEEMALYASKLLPILIVLNEDIS
jgi:glycosyltransferase involved in cell wall biosynthesis